MLVVITSNTNRIGRARRPITLANVRRDAIVVGMVSWAGAHLLFVRGKGAFVADFSARDPTAVLTAEVTAAATTLDFAPLLIFLQPGFMVLLRCERGLRTRPDCELGEDLDEVGLIYPAVGAVTGRRRRSVELGEYLADVVCVDPTIASVAWRRRRRLGPVEFGEHLVGVLRVACFAVSS